jgi:hypothetical protein
MKLLLLVLLLAFATSGFAQEERIGDVNFHVQQLKKIDDRFFADLKNIREERAKLKKEKEALIEEYKGEKITKEKLKASLCYLNALFLKNLLEEVHLTKEMCFAKVNALDELLPVLHGGKKDLRIKEVMSYISRGRRTLKLFGGLFENLGRMKEHVISDSEANQSLQCAFQNLRRLQETFGVLEDLYLREDSAYSQVIKKVEKLRAAYYAFFTDLHRVHRLLQAKAKILNMASKLTVIDIYHAELSKVAGLNVDVGKDKNILDSHLRALEKEIDEVDLRPFGLDLDRKKKEEKSYKEYREYKWWEYKVGKEGL